MTLIFGSIIWSLIFGPICFSADALYINSAKAPILSEAKANSPVLLELSRGDTIKPIETKGLWIKASIKGKTGWISKLFTTQVKPLASDSLDKFNEIDSSKVGRVRLNYENKGAARGLVDSGPKGSRNGYQDNQKIFEGVQFMEEQKIDMNAIKTFRKEGRLKP